MNNDKYESIDKQVSKEIMQEFKGVAIEHVCPFCKADPELMDDCQDCKGEGKYKIIY
jgi:hypothetical protein